MNTVIVNLLILNEHYYHQINKRTRHVSIGHGSDASTYVIVDGRTDGRMDGQGQI